MRLHTTLTPARVHTALQLAKNFQRVGAGVQFAVITEHRSRTHRAAFDIQLGSKDNYLPPGTFDQGGKRMNVRRTRNVHGNDDEYRYAATWDEWGWFMHEIFELDPNARWGDLRGWGYESPANFNAKTDYKFTHREDA